MWPQIILTLAQRTLLTRALCWVIIVTQVMLVVIGVSLTALVLGGVIDAQLVVVRFALPTLSVVAVYGISVVILWLWRTCDRCAFHLYPIRSTDGVKRPSLVDHDYPDYRAERFFGSWRWGGLVSMATKGVVHCMRCGHADGAQVEYVIRQ